MIQLETLAKNHFKTARISDDNLKKFFQDHWQRLVVNPPGGFYTTIIADTEGAYNLYFGSMISEDAATAQRISKTATVDGLITGFKKRVSKLADQVSYLFDEGSPTWLEFFPLGVSEYSDASKKNIDTLMERLRGLIGTYGPSLGNDTSSYFSGMPATYKAARDGQLGKKGDVSAGKDQTSAHRDQATAQLNRNFHYLAFHFNGDVNTILSYFDESILSAADGDDDGEANEEETPES